MNVLLVFAEVSDQYGTDQLVAVCSDKEKSDAAIAAIADRRTYVQEWPVNRIPEFIRAKTHEPL